MSEFKQMTLRECGKYDYEQKHSEMKTGWGIISSERTDKGISRKDRVKKNKESK